MKRTAILAAALCSLILAQCKLEAQTQPLPEVEPKITISAPGVTDADVKAAIAAFRKACMPLGGNKMWSEIKEVTAHVMVEMAPYRLNLGWKNTLQLLLALPDELKNIPVHDRQTGVISGHVLYYYLGGGKTPGFLSQKRVSAFLCGQPVNQSGVNVFSSVPDLAVLNGKQ